MYVYIEKACVWVNACSFILQAVLSLQYVNAFAKLPTHIQHRLVEEAYYLWLVCPCFCLSFKKIWACIVSSV